MFITRSKHKTKKIFRYKGQRMPKSALVLGAGGFIGGHLVHRLKSEGHWVRGVDVKFPEYRESNADDFMIGDLRDPVICREVIDRRFDEVYQLAADVGGAGYIFTGEYDATVMQNSASINLNVLEACRRRNISRIFFFVLGLRVSCAQSK